jgi:hypothetical protein
VRWTWASSCHSVVSGVVVSGVNMPDGKFCSPDDMNCGTTVSNVNTVYDHTFTTAGTYPYFCAPHGVIGMTGTVIVQPCAVVRNAARAVVTRAASMIDRLRHFRAAWRRRTD